MSIEVIVLMGAPGSGKGTQAKRLSDKNPAYAHISTGDLFRKEIASVSALGKAIQGTLEKGQLVSDETTNEVFESQVSRILNEKLKNNSPLKALLLDGYPRTAPQSKALLDFVKREKRLALPLIIELEINEETLVERLGGRLINPRNGRIYHKVLNPPKVPGICDEDGQALLQRSDDQPQVIRDRYRLYLGQRDGIIGILEKAGSKRYKLDAEADPALLTEALLKLIHS